MLSVVFPGDKQDPLADASIPYQRRCPTKQISIRQELIRQLNQSDWLLIEGRTGLGKTREAGELAQFFNQEGWTVLWLKLGVWIDEPTPEHLSELNTNRKLLFLLDDLNQRMYFGSRRKSVRAENSPLEPLTEPLQTRLRRTLQAYEQFCGGDEMKVIATVRNEKQSDTPGQPSAWDKLEKNKYPKFWQRFTVYELPEPEDEAISQLLRETVPNTGIYAEEENYLPIARQNDRTFRNVVENLVMLRNRKSPLTPSNYRDTLKANWNTKYQDAVRRYPIAANIYDVVDLLQQLEVSLTKEIIQLTTLLISGSKPWQLWQRYAINKALNYLIDAEQILTPRDGQIEAKERTIEPRKYLKRLTQLMLKISEKKLNFLSLYNLSRFNDKYNYYEEALACANKLSELFPLRPEAPSLWLMLGATYYDLNRYDKALECYDKALLLKPNYYEALYNKAYVLSKLDQNNEALQFYEKALELCLLSDRARNNKGILLAMLNRNHEALQSFNEILRSRPKNHRACYHRGSAQEDLHFYEDALESYDKALELAPDYQQACYRSGIVLHKLHRYDDAIQAYDEALKLKPNDYQALYNKGIMLLILDRRDEAHMSFDKILEFQPDNSKTYYAKAIVYSLQNNADLAIGNLIQAIKFNPEYREMIKTDSSFDNVREKPEFKALIDTN